MTEQVDAAVASITLQDKVRLLSGAENFRLHGDDRIRLDPIVLSDGPTGVRGDVVVGGRIGCLLPNASLLAQSWNPELLAEVGDILAEEAIDQKTHVVLGPMINLHRSPLGGRLFESFSEDPLLTGALAVAYVKAIQAHGISATPKHFLGNESETQRTTVNAIIDPVGLREAYLMPFEIVVEDAKPWALMAAYNRVNGVPSTEQDELVNGIVKGDWGFDGVMMSDWGATKSVVESANGGLDLVMPGPNNAWTASLQAEVLAGRVTEAMIDDHVRRLLRLAWRVGAFPAGARGWAVGLPRPDSSRRREQLRRLAAESMVVLKNENAVLPLHLDQTVALIGRHATDTIAQGGGSALVRPPHVVSVAEGMASYFDAEHLRVVDGVETRTVLPAASPDRLRDPETGERGIRVRVYAKDGSLLSSRHLDLAELEDNQTGWLADAATIELEGAVQLPSPMRMRLGVRGPGRWAVTAPGYEQHAEISYHNGPGGGFFRPKSHADTVELHPGAVIRARVERGELPRILGLVLVDANRASAEAISAAVRAVQDVDTAVVVVGFTPDQETEGQDKTTLSLPGDQDALVAAVASSARRTVVVVNAATPILTPWIGLVDAVVFAGLPGQEAGHAIAAALTGEILPEGRLVTTFPASNGAGPTWSVTPNKGDLVYKEGPAVGYRGWYHSGQQPAFWFGHGLGYTDWAYQDAQVTRGPVVERVRVRIRNIGDRRGKETVQVYARPWNLQRPVRLIGWAQAALEPGEDRIVDVPCDARMQRYWDIDVGAWRLLSDVDVLIARGLGDVRVTIPLHELAQDESAVGGERVGG
jgi:beta-glucosidase